MCCTVLCFLSEDNFSYLKLVFAVMVRKRILIYLRKICLERSGFHATEETKELCLSFQ